MDAQLIGNPVRESIVNLPEPAERFAARPAERALRILVLGGSQGAMALNRQVPAALAIVQRDISLEIRHQAGRTLEEAREAYAKTGLDPQLDAFIDDMADAYGWADLVICRGCQCRTLWFINVQVLKIMWCLL